MEIGLITAFLGGALALLSPCSALLLPAFFASTVGARLGLLAHGGVFYLGLVITLVPFGLGIGALGTLVMTERGLVIAITSLLLVGFGIAQTLGLGFDLSRVIPGASKLQGRASAGKGFVRTLLLGAAGGIAGFCAGPILGAILSLALAQGNPWSAGGLLAVYGAGMVVPLMIIAALWQRLGSRGRGILRGRAFTVLGRQLHTTSVITGLMIITVGVLFWTTNGLVSLPSLVPTDVLMRFQERSALLVNPLFDLIVIVVLPVAGIAAWMVARRRRSTAAIQSRTEETAS
ncbi:cytochrome c biogenesis CcdA family protein [uncultured Agrococcus sp.]|uniref:cytochrome c biogenesis CcdA family protein n=1 Tax=uncultured Agrococcus sp. TaxID=382258 RepID=UPI0025E56983|nr:cytochrome c biogenesis CcdA family protein [uncultured Agrococcus sp.]